MLARRVSIQDREIVFADEREVGLPYLRNYSPKEYSAQDQSAARISLLWKLARDVTWNVSYERFQDRGTLPMSLMQEPRPGQPFWSALIDPLQR